MWIKKYDLNDTSDNLLIRRIEISFVVTWQLMIQNICFDYVLNNFRFAGNRWKDYVFHNRDVGIEIWK